MPADATVNLDGKATLEKQNPSTVLHHDVSRMLAVKLSGIDDRPGSHHTEPQSGSLPMTHYLTMAFDATPSLRDSSDVFVRRHSL